MSEFLPDLTMVMPTRNRPGLFAGALAHYADAPFRCRIIVGDGSDDEIKVRNRAAADECSDFVTYIPYPADLPMPERLVDLVEKIDTPFAVYAADDDLALMDGVNEALTFLRTAGPEYVGAHGIYYGCYLDHVTQRFRMHVEYATVSIDAPSVVGRIASLFERYQSVFYAVQRVEALRMESIVPPSITSGWAFEMYSTLAVLALGSFHALPVPYYLCNRQVRNPAANIGDPTGFLLHDPEMLAREYSAFRSEISKLFNERLGSEANWPVVIDQLCALYFSKHWNRGRINASLLERKLISIEECEHVNSVGKASNKASFPALESMSKHLMPMLVRGWPAIA